MKRTILIICMTAFVVMSALSLPAGKIEQKDKFKAGIQQAGENWLSKSELHENGTRSLMEGEGDTPPGEPDWDTPVPAGDALLLLLLYGGIYGLQFNKKK
jgi:hypothetical protein